MSCGATKRDGHLPPAAVRRRQLIGRCAHRLAPLSTTHRGDRGARPRRSRRGHGDRRAWPLVVAPAGVVVSGARVREVGAPRRGAAAAVRPPLQLVSRRCGGRRRLGESEWRWPWRASAAARGVRGGVRALRRRLGLMRPHRDGVVRLVDELDLLELVQRRVPRRGFEARSHGREEVLERLLGGRHLCSTAGVADTPLQRLAVAGAPRVGDGLRLDGLRLAQPPPHARDGVLQRIIDQDHPARSCCAPCVVVRLQQARNRQGGVLSGANDQHVSAIFCYLYITPVRRFVMRLDQSTRRRRIASLHQRCGCYLCRPWLAPTAPER